MSTKAGGREGGEEVLVGCEERRATSEMALRWQFDAATWMV